MSLYDRVRDGNGCFPHAWSPRMLLLLSQSLEISRTLSCSESCIKIINFVIILTFCYAFVLLEHQLRFLGKALVRLVSVD